jgi:hypothetical protein
LHCSAMAEWILKLVVAGSLVIACSVGLLAILQCRGIIDLRVLCGCREEKKRFDSLKQNPYADEVEAD